MNTEKVIGKVEHMKNDEIMILTLARIKVNDIEVAIMSIIFELEREINDPKTTDSRKEIVKSSIKIRWEPLLEEVRKQFKEQDK